jgi:DNA-binding Lrp family transcriptional regulator
MPEHALDAIDRAIVNRLQRGFPVSERPYLEVAQALGLTEKDLIARLQSLLERGVLSRFGPMFQAERIGGGYTLAAMQVPEHDFERVAGIVNACPQVAHNYRRENALNMWFVVAAAGRTTVSRILGEIERDCGYAVFEFPRLREYRVALDLPA